MDERLLLLKPKRYLCPMCGEWHDWELLQIAHYDEFHHDPLKCENHKDTLWVNSFNGSLYITIETVCEYSNRGTLGIVSKGEIKISDICESPNRRIISFILPINETENEKTKKCSDCSDTYKCFIYRLKRHGLPYIMFGLEFRQSDYEEIIGWRLFTGAKRDGDKEGHPDGKQ